MEGHFPDESKGGLCRYGVPSSTWPAGILSNVQCEETSNWTTHRRQIEPKWEFRLLEKFLSALVDTASKNLDRTTPSQIPPPQLMRQGATIINTQATLSELMDPASMNPEQLTPTPTKQDLLNGEIHKESWKLIEIQQREAIRRDLAGRMRWVPPDLRTGQHVFYWLEDLNKFQQGRNSWRWLKVEILAVKGSVVVISTGSSIFRMNACKLKRPLDTVDLEELPDSHEGTKAPVLWLSCEGQTDVWELFSDNS